MDLEKQNNEQRFKLSMNKAFEIFGAIIILTFMVVVLWQSTDFDRNTNQIIEHSQSDLSPQDNMGDTDGVIKPVETPPSTEEQVFCTMDAKMCPDGSFVGRVAPNCDFAECPQIQNTDSDRGLEVLCDRTMKAPESCIEIYEPVCAQVEVQCVTTPCNPVPETFSNGCHACMQKNVLSYTEGACGDESVTE